VLAVTALVSTIAFYVYEANRNGASVLGNDLVTAIEKRISIEMNSYLEPSQRLVELIDDAVGGKPVFKGKAEAESFAKHALLTIPSATGVSYADIDGNFLYVLRTEKGTIDTKLIDRRNGGHRVTWTRRSSSGVVVSTEEIADDNYDPRVRPWYIAGANARKPVWTETYQNQMLHRPTISYVVPRFGFDGKLLTMISIDIELDDLCTFLSQLVIGVTGKAYIIDRSGHIVAFPDADWKPANDENARPPRLDELNDPVLTRAYDRLRVEGFKRMVLDFGDRRVIIASEPVKMISDRDWLVLIVVPESDFIGFVTDSSLVALALSAGVVVIVALLAGLLGWRGIQAGRRVADAIARERILQERTGAFIELARNVAGNDEGGFSIESATEIAAEACEAKRAAIWRLSGDGQSLSCEDSYDTAGRDHTEGLTLHRDEFPVLFAALDEGTAIDTIGSPGDKRVVEVAKKYLRPSGIQHIYIAPIMRAGRPLGMLGVEDPQVGDYSAGLKSFCDALAILLAFRMAGATTVGMAPGQEMQVQEARSRAPMDAFAPRKARLEQVLIRNDASWAALADNALSRAAVGIIKLPEWTSVARRAPDGGGKTGMDVVVHELRTVIENCDVSYAAQLDDHIVIAAYTTDESTAARDAVSVAMALLEMRDRLTALEEKWQTSLDFQFAIDVGPVMHSTVGGDPTRRNLWGGAIGIAKILAATTAPRTIATSETAYQLLSAHFLLRPRGTYFLPETGMMRTFVMVGPV
jgi:class 3 adenylate cyclase